MSDGNSSDATAISENIGSSSSDSSSSEYSDWVADHSVNLEPPQRNRRQRKRKPASTTSKPVPQTVKKSQPDNNVNYITLDLFNFFFNLYVCIDSYIYLYNYIDS